MSRTVLWIVTSYRFRTDDTSWTRWILQLVVSYKGHLGGVGPATQLVLALLKKLPTARWQLSVIGCVMYTVVRGLTS